MVSRRAMGAVGATVGLGVAAGLVTCAVVAPRPANRARSAWWEEFRRFRYADGGVCSPDAPRESLAAFTRARELGFGVRLNVRLTLDGSLAVCRDSSLVRACGQEGTVELMSLSALGELRLKGSDEPVPTLGEVLRLFEAGGPSDDFDLPAAAPVMIELRTRAGNAELLARKATTCIDAYDVRSCVACEDPRALSWLRRNRPDIIRGLVVRNYIVDGGPDLSVPRRFARTGLLGNSVARPDFLACAFSDRSLPAVRLACGVLGCRLATWGVSDERDLRASEAEGAPAVFEGFIPSSASSTIGE